jgi:hypothetical protein
MAGAAAEAARKATKLYYFEKYIDSYFQETVVKESKNMSQGWQAKHSLPHSLLCFSGYQSGQ